MRQFSFGRLSGPFAVEGIGDGARNRAVLVSCILCPTTNWQGLAGSVIVQVDTCKTHCQGIVRSILSSSALLALACVYSDTLTTGQDSVIPLELSHEMNAESSKAEDVRITCRNDTDIFFRCESRIPYVWLTPLGAPATLAAVVVGGGWPACCRALVWVAGGSSEGIHTNPLLYLCNVYVSCL